MTTHRAKPFPWTCLHCGTRTVNPVTEDYVTKTGYDGKTYEVCVANAVIPSCSHCGRKVLTDSVNRQISAALRAKLELLTPEEIKGNIETLGLSQKEVASRLGVAQETLSRWITGAVLQTRSNDRALRVFFYLPAARELLKEPMDPAIGRCTVLATKNV
jgi:DNA-binding transcriptional regulator YiaG